MQQKQNQAITGPKFTDTNQHGAINELYVAQEAMKKGARVFRNLSPSGDTDLIFEKDGQLLRVDVKHMKLHHTGTWQSNHTHKAPENVYYCFINPETLSIRWQIYGNSGPGGIWADFWNETTN